MLWGWTEHLDFWLATLDGFCRVLVSRAAVDGGRLMAPKGPWGSMGVVDDESLAYLTTRPSPDGDAAMPSYEIGACGYGPRSGELAARLAERVCDWDRDGGPGVQLWVEAHRAGVVQNYYRGTAGRLRWRTDEEGGLPGNTLLMEPLRSNVAGKRAKFFDRLLDLIVQNGMREKGVVAE